jgi:hypothetical protein
VPYRQTVHEGAKPYALYDAAQVKAQPLELCRGGHVYLDLLSDS